MDAWHSRMRIRVWDTRASSRLVQRSAFWLAFAVFAGLLSAALPTAAQGDDQPKKETGKTPPPPSIVLTMPLAIVRDSTVRLHVRGTGLSDATQVRCEAAGKSLQAVIKSKSKSAPPAPLKATDVGDSQVEIELTVPADVSADEAKIIITTPAGESSPRVLRLLKAADLTVEKEPNGAFANAQEIHRPTTIAGTIGEANDVDVFRFTGKAGQTIKAQVYASRLGSPLDSLLTLYDSAGHVVAANDDGGADFKSDSRLSVKLPADGVYYLSLTDANGRGGKMYAYLLEIK